MKHLVWVVLILSTPAWSQSLSLQKLVAASKSQVEVTLDGPLLQAALGALDSGNRSESAARQVASKLGGVYVHQFTFEEGVTPNEQLVLDQLKPPAWSRIVTSKSKEEQAFIFVKKSATTISSLVVVARKKNELSVVELLGALNPDDLALLSGKLGIPDVTVGTGATDAGRAQ